MTQTNLAGRKWQVVGVGDAGRVWGGRVKAVINTPNPFLRSSHLLLVPPTGPALLEVRGHGSMQSFQVSLPARSREGQEGP